MLAAALNENVFQDKQTPTGLKWRGENRPHRLCLDTAMPRRRDTNNGALPKCLYRGDAVSNGDSCQINGIVVSNLRRRGARPATQFCCAEAASVGGLFLIGLRLLLLLNDALRSLALHDACALKRCRSQLYEFVCDFSAIVFAGL